MTTSRLTQSAAHARLELHGSRYRAGKLETGELPWRRYEVEALAGALGVDVDELLRQAIQAADPDAERRREDVIAYAVMLDRRAWGTRWSPRSKRDAVRRLRAGSVDAAHLPPGAGHHRTAELLSQVGVGA